MCRATAEAEPLGHAPFIVQPIEEVITRGEQADVELMAAVAAGEPAAQRVLLDRLGRRVRKVTGLLCHAPADADDAAQLALIEILESAHTFQVATSLVRWAERVTIRTTLRLARRERRRKDLLERWLPPGTLPWGGPLHQSSVEELCLDALLGRLSQERFQAFVLHHALDYRVDEIAQLTGAPLGTIKDRLVSARKQLRKMLCSEARVTRAKLG